MLISTILKMILFYVTFTIFLKWIPTEYDISKIEYITSYQLQTQKELSIDCGRTEWLGTQLQNYFRARPAFKLFCGWWYASRRESIKNGWEWVVHLSRGVLNGTTSVPCYDAKKKVYPLIYSDQYLPRFLLPENVFAKSS